MFFIIGAFGTDLNPIRILAVFNRPDIIDMQWWRLISGHFVHSNLNHLYLNCAGLLLVWALHGEYYAYYRLFLLSAIASVLIGLSILILTHYQTYFGLSGVIHFLLIWGALKDIQRRERTGYLLFIGIVIKVLYELTGADLSATSALIGASVATEAHAIGVISSIFTYIIFSKIKKAT